MCRLLCVGWRAGPLVALLSCGARTQLSLSAAPHAGWSSGTGGSGGSIGAGDGSPSGDGSGLDVVTDAHVPCKAIVSEVTPAPEAFDVPTSSPIRVALFCIDGPLDPQAFAMRVSFRGHDVAGHADWDPSVSALTFLPARRLGLGTT